MNTVPERAGMTGQTMEVSIKALIRINSLR